MELVIVRIKKWLKEFINKPSAWTCVDEWRGNTLKSGKKVYLTFKIINHCGFSIIYFIPEVTWKTRDSYCHSKRGTLLINLLAYLWGRFQIDNRLLTTLLTWLVFPKSGLEHDLHLESKAPFRPSTIPTTICFCHRETTAFSSWKRMKATLLVEE